MKFKLVAKDARLPTLEPGAVGYDMYSVEQITLPPFDPEIEWEGYTLAELVTKVPDDYDIVRRVGTGVAVGLPDSHVGLFRDRSSIGSRGIIVTGGVIDPSYRGETLVCLLNLLPFRVTILKGDKIAQMLVMPCVTSEPEAVDDLSKTERGAKGFGSTGV